MSAMNLSTSRTPARFFAQLPEGIRGLFGALSRLGSLWAVLLIVSAAFVARRWRLGSALALAGCAAWFFGRLMAFMVGGSGFVDAIADVFDTSKQPVYPTVPLAVIDGRDPDRGAVPRPVRYDESGRSWCSSSRSARFTAPTGRSTRCSPPSRWAGAIAALVHLAFGSPAGRPTVAQVAGRARRARRRRVTTCAWRRSRRAGSPRARRPCRRCGAAPSASMDVTPPTRSSSPSSGDSSSTRTPARRSR